MTDLGMESTTAVLGSCAMTYPPAFLMASAPRVPSSPIPLKMTPMVLAP